jgi:hypothetical protein
VRNEDVPLAACPLREEKTGNNRWYDVYVPLADEIYDQYLVELHSEEFEEEL